MDLRVLALMLVSVLAGQALLGEQATGVGLDITIREAVTGHATWFNMSDAVQRFGVRLENTGSVNCFSRPRIDFYTLTGNSSLESLVYTAWGSEETIMTGGSREWRLCSGLPEGEYAAVLRTYHCNEIFEEEPYVFSVPSSEREDSLTIEKVEVRDGYIEVFVRSPGGARDVVVIPESYPRGWIFQAGEAGDIAPGGTASARLGFIPVKLDGASVTVKALSGDGRASGQRQFSMSVLKEDTSVPWGVVIVAGALLVFLLYFSKNIIKIWRR